MKQKKSVEDYLKTIYILSKEKEVHGVKNRYICERLGGEDKIADRNACKC